MYRRLRSPRPLPLVLDRFGVRGVRQVMRDLRTLASHLLPRDRFLFDLTSAGLLRPDLSLPAYAGLVPESGRAPIYNFFDRSGGGVRWRGAVSRRAQRDHRGGRLSYDEHDGTDLVCPPGTPVVAAAPGVLVATRDTWLRGGLTACVDHGEGVVTQYTHLSRVVAAVGQPVARGEIIAESGVSGYDIAQFFPWVPPHLHFSVWVQGRAVDPYRTADEPERTGTWAHGKAPRAVGAPLPEDPDPSAVRFRVDEAALERVRASCLDARVRGEIDRAASDAGRVAIIEDSLHHDEPRVWPDEIRGVALRLGPTKPVALTLPLSAELYETAAPADTRWTRP